MALEDAWRFLKATDFAYFPSIAASDEKGSGDFLADSYQLANSPFHLKEPPTYAQDGSLPTVQEQQGSLHSLSNTQGPRSTTARINENLGRKDTSGTIAGLARTGTPGDDSGPKGKKNLQYVPEGHDEHSALINLRTLGDEYKRNSNVSLYSGTHEGWEKNPYTEQLEELESNKNKGGRFRDWWPHNIPLAVEQGIAGYLARRKNRLERKRIGVKSKNWEEGGGRERAISESDKNVMPSLLNVNDHEVGHNATIKEINAAIDADPTIPAEEKFDRKLLANEHAAFTIGEFSDSRHGRRSSDKNDEHWAYDEDGNPLSQQEHWEKVIQARKKMLGEHTATSRIKQKITKPEESIHEGTFLDSTGTANSSLRFPKNSANSTGYPWRR